MMARPQGVHTKQLSEAERLRIRHYFEAGLTKREICQRLCVTVRQVRTALAADGPKPRTHERGRKPIIDDEAFSKLEEYVTGSVEGRQSTWYTLAAQSTDLVGVPVGWTAIRNAFYRHGYNRSHGILTRVLSQGPQSGPPRAPKKTISKAPQPESVVPQAAMNSTMASTGPQLPRTITKRKRSPDDDAGVGSPSSRARVTARAEAHQDGLARDGASPGGGYDPSGIPGTSASDPCVGPALPPILGVQPPTNAASGDGYGPSEATATCASKPCIGPTLPPILGVQPPTNAASGYGYGPSEAPATCASKPCIGPSLPPNLGFQPPTNAASGNGYGPSVNPSTCASQPCIGPALPPNLGAQPPTTNEVMALDDSDTDANSSPPSALNPSQPRRQIGPALPPAPLEERPAAIEVPSDDDSDDDYGPALPTSASHIRRQANAEEAAALEAAQPKALQRDDWMVVPPAAEGSRSADPSKIKARKFNSGPRAIAGSGAGTSREISSIWTETPEQKRIRLENAVLGRAGPDDNQQQANADGVANLRRREEEERADNIRQNVEGARGRSLYAEHQLQKGGKGGEIEAEEDDPSKRAFDKEKDMKLGGKIGTAERQEFLKRAANFGDRFSKGTFL